MDTVTLSHPELSTLIEGAYQRGAGEILRRLGVDADDEHAARDFRDLREFIEFWRDMKRAAIAQLGKWLAYTVLAAVLWMAGAGHLPNPFKG